MAKITRRRFLQISGAAAGAAAVASIGVPLILSRRGEVQWAAGTAVHPNIDALRVVGLTDAKMTTQEALRSTWATQEQLVNTALVHENIDKLACSLVRETDASKAWKAVFVKPPKKAWSDTVVAIKSNNIYVQHTRSAVMSKVCHVLTDVLGVRPSNVHIYDATHGKGMAKSTPFAGLPEGCRIDNRWGGVTVSTPVGEPFPGGTAKCVKALSDQTVDILINIAMCKGHSSGFGGFTMTLKNHLGTFEPRPAHRRGAGMAYIVGINRTPEILGQLDKKTGKVVFPRQQLCLIDALWASEPGPTGPPTAQPNFLAMGTFGPAVDYLVATELRAQKMGWKINNKALDEMLSGFGLPKDKMGKIVSVG